MENFTKIIKDWLIDELEDYKGQNKEVYPEDLGYELTKYINEDGSVDYSAWQASEFIKENFYMFGDLVEYVKDNYDMDLNPMLEPEKAEVIAYIEGVNQLLNSVKAIEKAAEESEYEQIILTDELIDEIIKELNASDYDITF